MVARLGPKDTVSSSPTPDSLDPIDSGGIDIAIRAAGGINVASLSSINSAGSGLSNCGAFRINNGLSNVVCSCRSPVYSVP